VCFPAVWPSGPFASSWDVNEIKRVNYLSPCPSIKLLCKDASINNVGVTMSVYKVALQRVLLSIIAFALFLRPVHFCPWVDSFPSSLLFFFSPFFILYLEEIRGILS